MNAPRALPAAPLPIASVVDQVYEAIRERITSGYLPRGDRVHQEDLADELGVSRTPVREALRRLARGTKDGPQARRLLALAEIYDGGSGTDAARIGGT